VLWRYRLHASTRNKKWWINFLVHT
jgi:hypothetical protein